MTTLTWIFAAIFTIPSTTIVGFGLLDDRKARKARQRSDLRRAELQAGRKSDLRVLRSSGGHRVGDGRRAA